MKALIFRTISESDIAMLGNSLVVTLLRQAGFDPDAPITRYYEPGNGVEGGVWVFWQDLHWRESAEFAQVRQYLKESVPIRTNRPEGTIFTT